MAPASGAIPGAAWSGCEEAAEAVVRSFLTTSRTIWTLNSSEYCDAGAVSVLSTRGRKSSPVRQAPRTPPGSPGLLGLGRDDGFVMDWEAH